MQQDILGVKVSFPYQPYSVQTTYMEKVIESCETSRYALLESPTGTGKTLSLLCSTLSWRLTQKKDHKILYTSRTHSQLNNVVKELKKTIFKPKLTHLASRANFCLVDQIRNMPVGAQVRACKEMRDARTCMFYNEERITSNSPNLFNECFDTDEFVEECKKMKICPYMCAQINATKADLILAPYTYVIDPRIRKFMKFDMFMDSIMIFDEGHNFLDSCSDTMTIELYFRVVHDAVDVMSRIDGVNFSSTIFTGGTGVDVKVVNSTRATLEALLRGLDNLSNTDPQIMSLFKQQRKNKDDPVVAIQRGAKFIYEFFEQQCNITYDQAQTAGNSLDSILQHTKELHISVLEEGYLEMTKSFFEVLFPSYKTKQDLYKYIDDYFTICITNVPSITVLCFTPSPGFREIALTLPRTIIITSGTLSPMRTFEQELDHEFPIKLENKHVADPSNIYVGIIDKGMTNKRFQFTFVNRGDKGMKKELAQSINSLYNTVPSGILTFFPSFSQMDSYAKIIHDENKSRKEIFVEPREGKRLMNVLNSYKKKAVSGAALLAVCRGKMSEGLDFSDEFARCVCVVGIPFPNATDYRVDFKKTWLDRKKKGRGSQWYLENAMRAVNQSIGRAIRHKDDFACILLIDERYLGFENMLSKWIQPSLHKNVKWSTMISEIKEFFATKAGSVKPKKYSPMTPSSYQFSISISHSEDSRDSQDTPPVFLPPQSRQKSQSSAIENNNHTTSKIYSSENQRKYNQTMKLFKRSQSNSNIESKPNTIIEPSHKIQKVKKKDNTQLLAEMFNLNSHSTQQVSNPNGNKTKEKLGISQPKKTSLFTMINSKSNSQVYQPSSKTKLTVECVCKHSSADKFHTFECRKHKICAECWNFSQILGDVSCPECK